MEDIVCALLPNGYWEHHNTVGYVICCVGEAAMPHIYIYLVVKLAAYFCNIQIHLSVIPVAGFVVSIDSCCYFDLFLF